MRGRADCDMCCGMIYRQFHRTTTAVYRIGLQTYAQGIAGQLYKKKKNFVSPMQDVVMQPSEVSRRYFDAGSRQISKFESRHQRSALEQALLACSPKRRSTFMRTTAPLCSAGVKVRALTASNCSYQAVTQIVKVRVPREATSGVCHGLHMTTMVRPTALRGQSRERPPASSMATRSTSRCSTRQSSFLLWCYAPRWIG